MSPIDLQEEEMPNPLSILVMQRIVDAIMISCGIEEEEPVVPSVSLTSKLFQRLITSIPGRKETKSNV